MASADLLTLSNDVFRTYAACVTLLSLKMTVTAWHTVARMISSGGYGMRNPEDLIAGPATPQPKADMIRPYEPTERLRRMMGHDLENNVPFFAVGMVYVLLDAGGTTPLRLYAGSKFLHHGVYLTGQRHELRAAIWTFTSCTFLYMCARVMMVLLL
uniref:Microsomal glutathione S-transferase 1 n=1 Tax=Trieres chinensis TaxID=1514140 RepID=A0A7S1ZIV5_TRICV|mmetsp:Transcript_26212/g.53716  ORF Transcript_26212/g.53716 Transcript_26212/m.53716 type:complete len:156 (+) Transcript_26212:134-601(+)